MGLENSQVNSNLKTAFNNYQPRVSSGKFVFLKRIYIETLCILRKFGFLEFLKIKYLKPLAKTTKFLTC